MVFIISIYMFSRFETFYPHLKCDKVALNKLFYLQMNKDAYDCTGFTLVTLPDIFDSPHVDRQYK